MIIIPEAKDLGEISRKSEFLNKDFGMLLPKSQFLDTGFCAQSIDLFC